MAWGLSALFSGFGSSSRKRGREEGVAEQRDGGEQRSGRKAGLAAVAVAPVGRPKNGASGSGAQPRKTRTDRKVTFKAEGPATRARREQLEPEAPSPRQSPPSKQRSGMAAAAQRTAQDKRGEPASKKQRQQRAQQKQQAQQPAQKAAAAQKQRRDSAREHGMPAPRQEEASPAPQHRQQQRQKGEEAEQAGPRRQDRQPRLAAARRGVRAQSAGPGDVDLPGPSNRQPEQVVDPPAPSGNEPSRTTGGMKRVRSSWKMRPLFIDEKLRVFVEGRDDEVLHYDGGEFYQWLKDCEADGGKAEEGFCYPLIVQDQDMRTVLEIKPPAEAGKQQQQDAIGHVAKEGPITVPTIKELPRDKQPDAMLDDGPPSSAAAKPASRAVSEPPEEAEEAGDLDPPYVRYLDPTPDEMDLAVEYDLDEDDEEWLEAFNERARKGKSRKARIKLSEDWLERLMDRMEKEYTHALQRNPEKWVVHQPAEGSSSDVPSVTLPPIEEVFPLKECMLAPGMHHYPNIIEAVYSYWKGKHSRAGMPLIQRLWYEPPWHRKKAAERLAEDDGGEGPFLAHDAPLALQNVRRRKLDTEEIRVRFNELRRDLDAARLLADQVRKREKLKKQELRLFQEEWVARLAEIQRGKSVLLRNGQLRHPPPTLSAVAHLGAAGGAADAWAAAAGPGEQDAADAAEDRAARLAARRSARDAAAAAGSKKRSHGTAVRAQASRRQSSHAKQQGDEEEDDEEDEDASATEAADPAEVAAGATTSRRQQKQKSPAPRKAAAQQQQQQQQQQQHGGGGSRQQVQRVEEAAARPKRGRGRPPKRRQPELDPEPELEAAVPSGEHASDSEVENKAPPSRPKRARIEPASRLAVLQRQQQQRARVAAGAARPAVPLPPRTSNGRFMRVSRPLKEINGDAAAAEAGGRRSTAAASKRTGAGAGGAGRKGRSVGSGGGSGKANPSPKRPTVAIPRISREVLSLF